MASRKTQRTATYVVSSAKQFADLHRASGVAGGDLIDLARRVTDDLENSRKAIPASAVEAEAAALYTGYRSAAVQARVNAENGTIGKRRNAVVVTALVKMLAERPGAHFGGRKAALDRIRNELREYGFERSTIQIERIINKHADRSKFPRWRAPSKK